MSRKTPTGGRGSNQYGPRGESITQKPAPKQPHGHEQQQAEAGEPPIDNSAKQHDDVTTFFGMHPDYSVENWWPPSVEKPWQLPIFSGQDWHDVLEGKAGTKHGGHTWEAVVARKINGKTAFPEGWGANEIGEAAAKVLRSGDSRVEVELESWAPERVRRVAQVQVGTYRMVVVVSFERSKGGSWIITTHPVSGDGVAKLVDGRMVYQPLKEI